MTKLFRAFFVFVLMMIITAVYAQDDDGNRLENPSFELPFVEQGGNPIRQVAQGWVAWHTERQPDQPSWRNRQPEYQPATVEDGFVHNGDYAQVIFNNTWWTHEAGVYQEVHQVEVDSEITFSVYVHVWSSKFEDKTLSQDAGGVSVQIGIDPTGGIDPTSESIIWSDAIEQYDAFVEHTLNAVAENETITVWVKSFVDDPVQNSFVYVDDASLFAVSADEEPADAETDVTEEPAITVEPTDESAIDEEPADDETDVTEEPAITVEPTDESAIDEEPAGDETDVTQEPTITVEPTDETAIDEEPADTETDVTEEPAITVEPTDESAIDEEPADDETDVTEEPTITVEPTDEATMVLEPTLEPTIEPTPTVIIPTSTSTPIPTVVVPTATATPTAAFTNTPLPPTATPTPIVLTDEEEALTDRVVHVVSRGETVGRIAAYYGSTVNAISYANNLNPDNLIFIGQELIIPTSPDAELPTEEPTYAPTLIPTLIPVEPTATPEQVNEETGADDSEEEIYYVRYGDTLAKIAWRYQTTVFELAQRNAIVNVNRIYVGQALVIPAPVVADEPDVIETPEPIVTPEPPDESEIRYYTVQYGDSLYRISGLFNVSIDAIAEANNIVNYNLIYRGQVLIIP